MADSAVDVAGEAKPLSVQVVGEGMDTDPVNIYL